MTATMTEQNQQGSPQLFNAVPDNLYADLRKSTGTSVNDLRFAFQSQRFYERSARGGTRNIEFIASHFGVSNPDARLQRTELVGTFHAPLQTQQVLQTSSTDSTSPQGNTSAFSLTGGVHDAFVNKSFTEHGCLLFLGGVRTVHSYSQGQHPMFTRYALFDFYTPEFANLPEQPIYNRELFATGNSIDDKKVFGYKEAWAELRSSHRFITGKFRPNITQNLAY